MENTHTTKDGKQMLISEMSDEHLFNTLKRIISRSKEGIVVESEIIEEKSKEFHFSKAFGKRALDVMNYEAYAKEMYSRINKRKR